MVYQTETAFSFNPETNSWIPNAGIYLVDTDSIPGSSGTDITLTGTFKVNQNGYVQLPTRDGYLISASGIEISEYSGPTYFYQDELGHNYLQFHGSDMQEVTISYSLGKADTENLYNPSSYRIEQMKEPLIESLDTFPPEIQTFMQELKENNDMSDLQKAKAVQEYIQLNFRYSLNPAWSDYYHGGENATEFFSRIFQIQKTDCDVSNSALIAMLRYLDIPAALDNGFAHSGGILSPQRDKITASSGHGWTKAYIDNQWVTLDATPIIEDDYTREKRKGNTPLNLEFEENVRVLHAMIENYVKKNPLELTLLGLETFNLALYGAAIIMRRGNNKKIDELLEKVSLASKEYTGEENRYLKNTLIRHDRALLEGIKDEERSFRETIGKGIFPFGILAFFDAKSRRGELKALPYSEKEQLDAIKSEQIDIVKFTTEVLGYKPEQIEETLVDV